jgi:ATP-dependent DNA helicase RecQ
MIDITLDAQKIFSCIYRMRERFGIGLVAEVLKGSRKAKILELRFDELTTHGIMHDIPLQEIKDRINYLVAESFLQLSSGEYPVVKLLPNAVSVIKGETKVTQKVSPPPSREKAEEISLFDRLRALRRELALRENLPPYMIFADSTLREMAQLCPSDHRSMIRISGVGERKLEKYGSMFLEEIRNFCEETKKEILAHQGSSEKFVKAPMLPNCSLDAFSKIQKSQQEINSVQRNVPAVSMRSRQIRSSAKASTDKVLSHQQTFILYQEGYSLEDIARVRNVTALTVQQHLVRCSLDGQVIPWDDFIPIEQESLILQAVRQVGREKLRPIKELLSDEVEWFTIQAVLEKYKIPGEEK